MGLVEEQVEISVLDRTLWPVPWQINGGRDSIMDSCRVWQMLQRDKGGELEVRRSGFEH